ncbi:MAG TPA: prepilin-type N-terminal cleavage/methylation domain-containing protein, partial [Polyangiales bacterium]
MKRAGFTILEVMIAVVILAIGLGALFASEAGAIRMAQKARTSTIATLLARCKMAEIEEQIAKSGW